MAAKKVMLLTCLLMMMALLVQMQAEASLVEDSKLVGIPANGMYRRLLRAIDCKGACGGRCKKASAHDRCLRACGACCARCKCVPPGTYGNKEVCPCYANMKTHGNKPKCP